MDNCFVEEMRPCEWLRRDMWNKIILERVRFPFADLQNRLNELASHWPRLSPQEITDDNIFVVFHCNKYQRAIVKCTKPGKKARNFYS